LVRDDASTRVAAVAGEGYTFGDGDHASDRLAMVAALFDPPTRAFVERAAPAAAGTVVDLGCGPGNSTQVLAESIRCDRLLALDASADFVGRARRRVPEAAAVVHDVTALPLPGAPADVIFARLLLAHLPDPAATARAWRSQLAPGGVLLLDEIDAIRSDVPVLAEYERVVTELVASRGAVMAAGPELDGLAEEALRSGALVVDDRRTYPVDVAAAARMFRLNLAIWGDDPAMDHRRRDGTLDRLATGLEAVAAAPTGTITWHLRQLAVRASA
jgi:SAM-dependent methyltransferase